MGIMRGYRLREFTRDRYGDPVRRWSALGAAIILEVSATLALRAVQEQPWWLVLVVIGYVGSFVALAVVLRSGLAVGVAYGIWAACGVVVTAVFGAVFFHEPFTLLMGCGVVLVAGGVLLVEVGAQRAEGRRARDAAVASDGTESGTSLQTGAEQST
jgi:small multidrug resistance pump